MKLDVARRELLNCSESNRKMTKKEAEPITSKATKNEIKSIPNKVLVKHLLRAAGTS